MDVVRVAGGAQFDPSSFFGEMFLIRPHASRDLDQFRRDDQPLSSNMFRVLQRFPTLSSSAVTRALQRQPRRHKSKDSSGTFADRVVIRAQGGNGGAGCVSFARGPHQEIAPADGGHGGDGGDVYLQADESSRSLRFSTTLLKGAHGGKGMSAKRRGRDGEDVIFKVPRGTIVTELVDSSDPVPDGESGGMESGRGSVEGGGVSVITPSELLGKNVFTSADLDSIDDSDLDRLINELQAPTAAPKQPHVRLRLTELNEVGQVLNMARGGRGGRGNTAFKSSKMRSPLTSTPGAPGQIRRFELELKTIADVGLVGLPNAGKSTFLRAVSNARPRVASYAFTTLRPHVGVVGDLTIADIPGLIEGASENRGLGHDFLKHIERTSLLVCVIDISRGARAALQELDILRTELDLYLDGLQDRIRAIVLNKMDVRYCTPHGTGGKDDGEVAPSMLKFVEEVGEEVAVFPTSAKYSVGTDEVVSFLTGAVEQRKSDSNRSSQDESLTMEHGEV